MNFPKFLTLLLSASSDRSIQSKDEFGNVSKIPVRNAAIRTLVRPPFVPSAPTTKREWSKEEVEEFYKANPMLRI